MLKNYIPIPLYFGCANSNFPFIEETFDSLTTYKMLCKIAGVVNSIQEYLKDLNFEQYIEYVDTQIANLKNYVDSQYILIRIISCMKYYHFVVKVLHHYFIGY